MYLAKILTAAGPTYVSVAPKGDTFRILAVAPAPPEDPTPAYTGPTLAGSLLADHALLPPVRPGKIVCVGRNYRDHAAELGNDIPKEPLLFFKPTSSLLGSGATVLMPAVSSRVDYEGELALVIGARCRHLAPNEDVRPFIRGYTLVNDVTARDLQKTDGQWTRAKGFDTFCPTGPVIAIDEPSVDPLIASLTLTTRVNGELRQQGSTADFLFDIPTLLRYITSFMTLEPGDLIPTGTPAGVGPLAPGDVVAISIPGLGTLSNPFAAE